MESPVFKMKEEPASPQWEFELLDEVGGIWEGDLEVLDEAEADDVFWGSQDISELIGKEETILGLELDDIALDVVDDDGDIDLKEEPFSHWLDSGIYDGTNSAVSGLPTYPPGLWTAPESPADDKAAVFAPGAPAVPTDSLQTAPADLLREFEDVLSQAAGSLTPPDSPRSASGNNVLLQLTPSQINPLTLPSPSNSGFIVLQDMANSPAVNDELDELVAETYQKSGGGQVGKSACGRQQPWDSPTSTSGSCDSGYEDPDWSPDKSADASPSSDEPKPTKKLRLTSTEERRLRKKEQNKNAATRYRMKKKMEMEEIIGEEKELLDRNDALKSDVVEITREIKYLKGLMGDLFRAKGLIRAK